MTKVELDFTDPDSLALILFLIVPGVVILYFRSLFINGRPPSGGEIAIRYFAVSAIYQSIAYPWVNSIAKASGAPAFLLWPVVVFLLPAIIGILLGLEIHYGWVRKPLRRLGVNPVHATPGAWDWRLGNMKSCWVFVTLKNDYKYAGRLGPESFASSESAERDLYIEQLYSWDCEGAWQPLNKSLLICGGEISTIEFIADTTEGAESEEAKPSDATPTSAP